MLSVARATQARCCAAAAEVNEREELRQLKLLADLHRDMPTATGKIYASRIRYLKRKLGVADEVTDSDRREAPPPASRQRTGEAPPPRAPPPPAPRPPRPVPTAVPADTVTCPPPRPAAVAGASSSGSSSSSPPATASTSQPPDHTFALPPLPPLVAPWTRRTADDETAAASGEQGGGGAAAGAAAAASCSYAHYEEDALPAASQASQDDVGCSQLSVAQAAHGDVDIKCTICIDMLYEPVTTPCGHHFCKACFSPSLLSTKYSCPICRAPIPLELCQPAVDEALWAELQAKYPSLVASRRRTHENNAAKEKAAAAVVAAVGAAASSSAAGSSSAAAASVERDILLAQMQRHRRVLQEATADYFTKLREELRRPVDEIVRCRCAEQYVCIRRTQTGSGSNRGRAFNSCPLGRAPRGCGFFDWVI